MSKQHAFQAEVSRLLHIVVHSLYSEREIFLRELVSNASDALDKLRVLSLTQSELMRGDDRLQISIACDKDAKTLTITDTGVGLTMEEAVEHLGCIAKSGTREFVERLEKGGTKDAASLIGQFGVGFYSAFMVADKVVVESRSATVSSDHGVRWESTGDGAFTTEEISRPQRGTTITLHMKEESQEYLDAWRLRSLIRKHSDFIPHPIFMDKELSEEDKKADKKAEPEQVNQAKALWTRPKSEITEENYKDFYRSACHQWDTPESILHFKTEGTLSFTALLFFPSQKPIDLLDRSRRGLSLYVKRVFIMDDCEALLPECLRFMKGVVDSEDLPLNVSREMLQEEEMVKKLRKILVKRILDHLHKLATSEEAKDKETFKAIENQFGAVLREGLLHEFEHKERLMDLARWPSTAGDEKTGLEDYVKRMKEGQDAIYCLTGVNLESAKTSPALEGHLKKGYEVLLMCDPVDDYCLQNHCLEDYKGKKIVHVGRGDADFMDDDAKKALEAKKADYQDLLSLCKDAIPEEVSEARLSGRLTDSPCCIVSDAHGMSRSMEDVMRQMGRPMPKQKRILEINPDHPLIQRLNTLRATQADDVKECVHILHDQAILADGGRLEDGPGFAKRVQKMLEKLVAK